MRVKRGKNYIGLKLSGPQSTNVLNEAEETAERLAARNEWAFQMSQFRPDLPAILQVERCTFFPITRFRRDLVLRLDERDGWWEVDARVPDAKPDSDANGSPPPPSGDGAPPKGGDGSAGPSGVNPAGGAAAAPPPAPANADEYRPISAAPRRQRAQRSAHSRVAQFIHHEWRRVRETSFFCHTASVFERQIARMELAMRRVLDLAHTELLSAPARALDLYASFSGGGQFVQDRRSDEMFAPQIFERAGLRLTLLTCSAYPKPNWECWLFGRRPEDEQVAA